ncbi:MAG: SH3 domain-containing protein [Pseudomonadota bacterium]
MKWLVAALVLWPWAVLAEGFPALYDVSGVARDDVLNIRQGPGANHPIFGAFGPFQTEIEVTGEAAETGWLRVNLGEGIGWVSPQFMTRTGPDWQGGMPERYACFGSEPFWLLHVNGATASWQDPEIGARRYTQSEQGPSVHVPDMMAARFEADAANRVTALITQRSCSDGMSDRAYGLGATLIRDAAQTQIMQGCCSIAP